MAANTKMIHVRVDDDIREEAAAVLGSFGLSVSEAVRVFLHRVVASQSFPLELKVPNETTRAALAEAREIRKARKARFATPEELFADLDGKKEQASTPSSASKQLEKTKRR
ncbi:type II toxin-antitoxin system RelB/DinJ family antitoxin [Pararhizobium sp. LjRoot255]|uniref:type II toxin-antitoxin system RelB/DinJ family antitoxin n=1 Tax=Pararhizobium sp. LjRoot255 TaxID=3342298 RepID=UPI003ED0F97E